jgi:hypothetical protein
MMQTFFGCQSFSVSDKRRMHATVAQQSSLSISVGDQQTEYCKWTVCKDGLTEVQMISRVLNVVHMHTIILLEAVFSWILASEPTFHKQIA